MFSQIIILLSHPLGPGQLIGPEGPVKPIRIENDGFGRLLVVMRICHCRGRHLNCMMMMMNSIRHSLAADILGVFTVEK